MKRTIGIILLCVYLIIVCLISITNIHFELERFVIGIAAGAAAVFLALEK